MAKRKEKKTSWKFDIGQENYDLKDGYKLYRPVLLDGKEIFRLDQTLYMGHKRNSTKEVLAALKKITGIEFNMEQLQRAMTIGVLEK
jgi:hypothetical protein